MAAKRKRTVISIKEKVEIINRLENGESVTALAAKYGIGKSTICDIKKKASNLMAYNGKIEFDMAKSARKTMRLPNNDEVDRAVYSWFVQQRSNGEPVSGPMVCEKARVVHEKINGNSEFKASTGWLQRFKDRHGIRLLDPAGEKTIADLQAAQSFKTKFGGQISGYDLDNVYNAEETALYWKALPKKPAPGQERPSPELKESRARLTIMVCANATGSHKLKLTIVGRARENRCLRAFIQKSLPVAYLSQKNAWINMESFMQWLREVFVPEVRARQQETGNAGRVMLLMDIAPFEPPENDRYEFDNIDVVFFPPKVTSLLQPMDQGVLETLKCLYRTMLLRSLLLRDCTSADVMEKFTIKDFAYLAADAWEQVKETTLRQAWDKLLLRDSDVTEPREVGVATVQGLLLLARQILEFDSFEEEDIQNWLNVEKRNPILLLTNDELCADGHPGDSDVKMGDDAVYERREGRMPTAQEALDAVQIVLQWAETDEQITSSQMSELKYVETVASKLRDRRAEGSSPNQLT